MDMANRRQQSTLEKSKINVSTMEICAGGSQHSVYEPFPATGHYLYTGCYLQPSEDFKGEGRGREATATCTQLNEVLEQKLLQVLTQWTWRQKADG